VTLGCFCLQKRRLEQERARVKAEKELREKVAARAFASNFLTNLQKNAFSALVNEGHFFDPLTAEVEEQFMPWLLGRVETRLESESAARAATEGALVCIVVLWIMLLSVANERITRSSVNCCGACAVLACACQLTCSVP